VNRKLYVYDPIRNIWSTETDMPYEFAYTEGVIVGGKIYIVGGVLSSNNTTHSRVYEYNTCSRTWRQLTSLSISSGAHSVSQVNGDIYIG
jgi:N-acetylneuraminic acid mutarotase